MRTVAQYPILLDPVFAPSPWHFCEKQLSVLKILKYGGIILLFRFRNEIQAPQNILEENCWYKAVALGIEAFKNAPSLFGLCLLTYQLLQFRKKNYGTWMKEGNKFVSRRTKFLFQTNHLPVKWVSLARTQIGFLGFFKCVPTWQ